MLAEDQGRAWHFDALPGTLSVGVAPDDLAAVVDALLAQRVRPHRRGHRVPGGRRGPRPTVEGCWSSRTAARGSTRPSPHVRGNSGAGSTGLGLDIVRRTAEASGGTMRLGRPTGGGAAIVVEFGAPGQGVLAASGPDCGAEVGAGVSRRCTGPAGHASTTPGWSACDPSPGTPPRRWFRWRPAHRGCSRSPGMRSRDSPSIHCRPPSRRHRTRRTWPRRSSGWSRRSGRSARPGPMTAGTHRGRRSRRHFRRRCDCVVVVCVPDVDPDTGCAGVGGAGAAGVVRALAGAGAGGGDGEPATTGATTATGAGPCPAAAAGAGAASWSLVATCGADAGAGAAGPVAGAGAGASPSESVGVRSAARGAGRRGRRAPRWPESPACARP